jgi:polyisoprenoid-binding protein YceI
MKLKHIVALVLLISVLSLSGISVIPVAAAETYSLDPVHSYILFRIKHLNVGYSYGRLNGASGTFVFDNTSPGLRSIKMQVNAEGIDTNVPKRDKHLKSADFFDVEQYSTISFDSSSIKKMDQDNYKVSGNLTFLGNTRPITLTARQTGFGKDPWGHYRRGFETVFTIKRSEFGMDYMLAGLSDEVELTVSVEGIRQPPK